jgi:hypothetical protein
VLARTKTLDSASAVVTAAMTAERAARQRQQTTEDKAGQGRLAQGHLTQQAQGAYNRARFRQELLTFLVRLAITLPLLVLSGWLVWTRRTHAYWPLYRGVVLFGVFAFFVELVPYLPSYGGYVRLITGVVTTVVAGIAVIRHAQTWLARRAAVASEAEATRRARIAVDAGYAAVASGRCPSCERAINATDRFCGHCGLQHHAPCHVCTRVLNTYTPFCPTCGTATPSHAAPAASATSLAGPDTPITLAP